MFSTQPLYRSFLIAAALLTGLVAGLAVAQEPSASLVEVDGRKVTIVLPAGSKTAIVPNLHAPMRSAKWADGSTGDKAPEVVPLVDKWQVKVAESSEVDRKVQLALAGKPLTTEALQPIKPRADGGYDLPAHMGRVVSEKLRYELQPWKNTIGYWAAQDDYAYFLIQCHKPGDWNVGVLQGCGKGQGGSEMTISMHGPVADAKSYSEDQQKVAEAEVDALGFVVEETGHFQNFKWRHVGDLSVDSKGVFILKVSAKKIAKGAAMDFRAISLTPIPQAR